MTNTNMQSQSFADNTRYKIALKQHRLALGKHNTNFEQKQHPT